MNIGLVFPSKGRPHRIRDLVNSLSFNRSQFAVKIVLGLSPDDDQYNNYVKLEEDVNNRNDGFVEISHIDIPNWQGLGHAFNVLAKHIIRNRPDIDTMSMFGDDMTFEKNHCNEIFTKIKHDLEFNWGPDKIGCVTFYDGHNDLSKQRVAINGFVHTNWVRALQKFIPSAFYADYSDNWLAEVAFRLGRYRYYRELTIYHNHGNYNIKHRDKRYTEKVEFDNSMKVKSADIWETEKRNMSNEVEKLKNYAVKYLAPHPTRYLNPLRKPTKLSVLIPTLRERKSVCADLINSLIEYIKIAGLSNQCEILILSDRRDRTVGKKRNMLVKEALGEYVVFIDDDDIVVSSFFKNIFNGFVTNPDCITYPGIIKTLDKNLDGVKFIHTLDAVDWREEDGKLYRTPNHINVLRKSIVEKVKFPNKDVSEDYDFAKAIYPLLKTEYHIEQPQYIYRYNAKTSVQNMKTDRPKERGE